MKPIFLQTRAELTNKIKQYTAKGYTVYRVRTFCKCTTKHNAEQYTKANARNGILIIKGETVVNLFVKCKICYNSNAKQADTRPEILKTAFDVLAAFPCLENGLQKDSLFAELADVLGSYPKPQHKGDTVTTNGNDLAAYLFVSNARNAAILAGCGFVTYQNAALLANANLETALSVLID